MINGALIRVIAVIISAVFVIGSWVTTGSPETSFLRFFSIAVLTCTILLFVWDKWIWKWKLVQWIPGVSRNLSGTWAATLESFWTDPSTGTSSPAKTVYVVIRQTSSTASVTLISDESTSKSSVARVAEEDGSWVLYYLYTNKPRLEVRRRSAIHHGSAVLSATGSPAKRLEGGYWSDRDSKGQLKLTKRSKKLADDFEEAEEALKKLN
ncbi:hypothetical protein [Arthrobacter yangruifuii]|uniref:Cap15 family cyclic dinucleotide receptor domain-containing protein n=1 Tax=Arthrobacter yangruifuii TaxID=2606616 RepID=UPI0011B7ECC6|nr:hypothetical protein [Arthrobacter yangruifuii]